MKKLFYIFVAMIFTFSFITACSPGVEDIYEYEEISGGIKITNYKGKETEIVVPENINNKKVVSVSNTFSGNVTIKSITLPESCQQGNFQGCDNLEYLEFPGCKSDELYKFCPYSIKTLILPGVETINFAQSSYYKYTELEHLDVSGAKKMSHCQNLTAYFPKLKTLCVPGTLKYYLTEPEGYTHLSDIDNFHRVETKELTTENYTRLMKMIFGESYEIKILQQ